jgi:hypothetical protein
MDAIATHKDELEKLLEDLSSDRVVSGISFLALVDAYITRLDINCPDISAHVNPPPAQIDGKLTHGTNIDSKLRALLRATYNFKTARRAFPKISRCGPQASTGCSLPADARRTFQAANAFPGQRPLIDVGQRVNPRMQLKKSAESSEVQPRKQRNRSDRDKSESKPKPLFGAP